MPDREQGSHRHRSRSPRRKHDRSSHRTRRSHSPSRDRSARRSRSPRREHGGRHHHLYHSYKSSSGPIAKDLPFSARPLTKSDYTLFKPMFELYLDIQKKKDLWSMGDIEARGRWKSFIGKWNRGELAGGWYEPGTFERARKAAENGHGREENEKPATSTSDHEEYGRVKRRGRGEPGWKSEARGEESDVAAPSRKMQDGQDSDSDSDDYGPTLPGQVSQLSRYKRAGPTIPNMEDLGLKRENESNEAYARRKGAIEDRKWERKAERKAQIERLDELVPRAAGGTRERQLEKKREVNEKMKSFRDKGDGQLEVPDEELMGGGGGIGELKQKMSEYERKKTERELRREEINRARNAEREERLSEYRQKEDKTMEMLRNLAEQNFGPRAE